MAPGSSPVRLGCALLLVLLLLCSLLLAQILPGGRYEISVSNPDAQNAAAFAADAFNRGSHNDHYYKLLRILKAKFQVVAGFYHFLKVELVKTYCEKKIYPGLKYSDVERCAVPPEAKQQKLLCEFTVYRNPGWDQTALEYKMCQ